MLREGEQCPDCYGTGKVCPSCGWAQDNPLSLGCFLCSGTAYVPCKTCGGFGVEHGALSLEWDEIISQLMGTPAGRRELGIGSITFFDTYYCGMTWAPFRERWLETFDDMILECRQTGRKGRHLTIAPRSHGKTEAFVTVGTREVCKNRDIRGIYVGKTATAAQKRLGRIKSLLMSPRVQQDWCSAPELGYGPFLSGKDGRTPGTREEKWTDNLITVARSRYSVDGTFEAVGVNGTVTGGHFDLALVDDLEDDENVRVQARRETTREWLGGTFSPMMDPGSTSLFIGTRKHHDDAYSHMLKDPNFRVIQEKAILKWPESFEYVYGRDEYGRKVAEGVKVQGDFEVLWPEGRPIEFLLLELDSIKSRLFAREYQGEVQDDSAAPVKWEDLEAAMDAGSYLKFYDVPDVPGLIAVQGWDFALVSDPQTAESNDSDYSVGVTWAKDLDGIRYLLSLVRVRGLKPGRLQALVKAEFERWVALGLRPRYVAVEKNNFGELHYLGLKRQTDLPMRAHQTGKQKADPWEGVPSTAALFENDKVVLPTADEKSRALSRTLCTELWGLGREAHDDTVMALWIAETVLRNLTPTRRFIIGDVEIDERTAIEQEQLERDARTVVMPDADGVMLVDAEEDALPPDPHTRFRRSKQKKSRGAREDQADPRAFQARMLWGELGDVLSGDEGAAQRVEAESKVFRGDAGKLLALKGFSYTD